MLRTSVFSFPCVQSMRKRCAARPQVQRSVIWWTEGLQLIKNASSYKHTLTYECVLICHETMCSVLLEVLGQWKWKATVLSLINVPVLRLFSLILQNQTNSSAPLHESSGLHVSQDSETTAVLQREREKERGRRLIHKYPITASRSFYQRSHTCQSTLVV